MTHSKSALLALEQEIDKHILPFDPAGVGERLQTIPGVGQRVAQILLAEIGIDMSRFDLFSEEAGRGEGWM